MALDCGRPVKLVEWTRRPGLLLPVIKYLVFFDTFVFANSIFFATQFGRKSCFFSRTGFQGYVPISWWVSAILVSLPLTASMIEHRDSKVLSAALSCHAGVEHCVC